MLSAQLKPAHRLIRQALLCCCLITPSAASFAGNNETSGPETAEPFIELQQLLQILEQQSQILEKNTADYIRCIEQNTRAETDSLPEIETPEMITREWLSQLLNNLSAGVNSSETCQFLLDEILEKLPQRPPLSSETDQSI
ncbi:hypothetical protein [Aliamphritea spongicola]|uniref:hypothetical protein n=1 Tax=Aliamphritea spongicola TaxID=707589 RepID=UPI00196B6823|nr:hypothetical protein [Aliamphritea spongicola]MBN3564525.1 hypothetical protein [Aliamphritea spongicola]